MQNLLKSIKRLWQKILLGLPFQRGRRVRAEPTASKDYDLSQADIAYFLSAKKIIPAAIFTERRLTNMLPPKARTSPRLKSFSRKYRRHLTREPHYPLTGAHFKYTFYDTSASHEFMKPILRRYTSNSYRGNAPLLNEVVIAYTWATLFAEDGCSTR